MFARAVFLASLLACDTLPAIQGGVCGNNVVDPNEDCDTSAPDGALCRQCRFVCGPQASGAACPSGMGCGTDGTCRTPTGAYVPTAQLIQGTFSDVYAGDVDGDGRADVVGLDPNVISTSFFDATLATKTTIATKRHANVKVHPLLRDLSGDGRADLVVVRGNGTLVELGSEQRTFEPLAFPSSYLADVTNGQLIVFDAAPPSVGQTLLLMGTFKKTVSGILSANSSTGQGVPFLFMPSGKTPADLAGPVATAHVIENKLVSPCGELSFAFTGASEVDVFTICISDGSGGYKFNDYVGTSQPVVVPLPSNTAVVRGPELIDANADGHLDLIVGATTKSCTGCDEIDVAYGAGDGTFAAFAPYALGLMPTPKPGPLPLALGDLNGDGILDHVTTTDVLTSPQNNGLFTSQAHNHGAPWTQAVIGDFNHDGIADVAAGSSSAPDIAFYLGAGGGTFDPFVIPSQPSRLFVAGDFDGDLVKDLALAEIADSNDPLGDSVSVLFGNSVGAPSSPISMGRFTSMEQMIAGHFVDPFGILSATDGLLTLAQLPNGTAFGNFAGSGDRSLRSPFVMSVIDSQKATGTNAQPLRYAFGHFTSQSGPIQLGAIDDQFQPAPPPNVHHSWLMQLDAQGRVDMTTTTHSQDPLPDGLDWYSAALVAVDLDGSGADQLVALGPSSADATQGAVALAKVSPSDPTPTLTFGAPVPAPALVMHVETDEPGTQSGRVAAAVDLDGDGRPDVVAVATISGTTSVVVFWNDHTGGLGTMSVLPNPNGHPAVDFALVNAGGSGPSLAVLTDEGVSLVSFAARAPNVGSLSFKVDAGHRLAVGDIDGDGVEDLAVATSAGISIYRGKAVRP